jgi:hypothetical protein
MISEAPLPAGTQLRATNAEDLLVADAESVIYETPVAVDDPDLAPGPEALADPVPATEGGAPVQDLTTRLRLAAPGAGMDSGGVDPRWVLDEGGFRASDPLGATLFDLDAATGVVLGAVFRGSGTGILNNESKNPHGEVNATGWTADVGGGTLVAGPVRDTARFWKGTASLALEVDLPTGTPSLAETGNPVTVVAGDKVGIRVRAAADRGRGSIRVALRCTDSAGGTVTVVTVPVVAGQEVAAVDGTFQELAGVFTVPAVPAGLVRAAPLVRQESIDPEDLYSLLFVGATLVVKNPLGDVVPSYFDGDSAGALWTGTRHASTSQKGGAVFETSATDPKVRHDWTGVFVSDAAGLKPLKITTTGLDLLIAQNADPAPPERSIRWLHTDGSEVAHVSSIRSAGGDITTRLRAQPAAANIGHAYLSALGSYAAHVRAVGGPNTADAKIVVATSAEERTLLRYDSTSDFMQLASLAKNITAQNIATITIPAGAFQATVVVTHGLGGTPTNIHFSSNNPLYNYSWESVGATTFTIRARHRADVAGAASMFVYWQASKEG